MIVVEGGLRFEEYPSNHKCCGGPVNKGHAIHCAAVSGAFETKWRHRDLDLALRLAYLGHGGYTVFGPPPLGAPEGIAGVSKWQGEDGVRRWTFAEYRELPRKYLECVTADRVGRAIWWTESTGAKNFLMVAGESVPRILEIADIATMSDLIRWAKSQSEYVAV